MKALLLIGVIAVAGCSTVPRVGSATAEVKTEAPDRPVLMHMGSDLKPEQQAQALDHNISALMRYTLKLECILSPFVLNPRAESCMD